MDKFKVKRPHTGDREYSVGDTREAVLAEVQHLIPNTLEPISAKAEPTIENKMEPPATNKSTKPAKTK